MENFIPRSLVVVLTSWLLCVASLSAAETSAEPRLESGGLKILRAVVLHFPSDDPSGISTLQLTLFVQNVSDTELTVVTANTGVTIMNYDVPLYQMGLDTEERYDGVTMVPSLYQFNPVTLRPGEGTAIVCDYPLRSQKKAEQQYATVGYAVVPSLAERFNLWQGTLVSEPVKVQSVSVSRGFPAQH